MKKISFVIPCYGSEHTIRPVVEEIRAVVGSREDWDYEVCAVNDQSPDRVWDVLKELAAEDPKVKAACLAKNRNRPGALMAGMSFATGDYVILMDDDGQCPMDRLWDLLAPLEEGHDISIARYPVKKQSAFKNFGSSVNKKMTEIIIDKPGDLQFSNFAAMQRYIMEEIIRYKNPYPYMTGLMLRTTSDIVNVDMEERDRISGTTNFTFRKMLALWASGFTAFSVKPLRISTIIGFIVAVLGFVYGIVVILQKLFFRGLMLPGWSSMMAVTLFIGGIIMIMLGIIGEYLGRIYICINDSPQYVIKETRNVGERDKDR